VAATWPSHVNWAFESLVPMEEAGAVNAPHEFHFVCELSGYEEWVSTMVGKICFISFGYCEEVAMSSGVVRGSYCVGEMIAFSCICCEVGVN
jgi:hypothetical protein